MGPSARSPSPRRQRLPRILRNRVLNSAALSLAAVGAVTTMVPGQVHWQACGAGWLAAALNAIAGSMLHARAIGASINRFLLWGFAGNGLRMLFLFASICSFSYLTQGSVRRSFLASFFAGLFVFMGFEFITLLDIPPRHDKDGHSAERK